VKSTDRADWPSLLVALVVDTAFAWGLLVGSILLFPGGTAVTASAVLGIALVCIYWLLNVQGATLGAFLSGIRWRQPDGRRLAGWSAFILAIVQVAAGPLAVVLAIFLAGMYPGGLPSSRLLPIAGMRVPGSKAVEAADRYWRKWE
jgi:hypothetical protein